MCEQVGDFSYFWTIVCEGCPSFVFVSFIGLFQGFFRFSSCKRFCGMLLFVAVSCIDVHSFYFLFGVNGRE